jgi:hypothetical protein
VTTRPEYNIKVLDIRTMFFRIAPAVRRARIKKKNTAIG